MERKRNAFVEWLGQLQASGRYTRTTVRTYPLEELLATKLRALYQRKKGRDLYDLWYAAQQRDIDMG